MEIGFGKQAVSPDGFSRYRDRHGSADKCMWKHEAEWYRADFPASLEEPETQVFCFMKVHFMKQKRSARIERGR